MLFRSISASLKIDELVIARVAEVREQPDPLRRVEERLGGESPALQVEQLLFVPVAFDHQVLLASHPLHLGQGGFELEDPEVVEAGQGDNILLMWGVDAEGPTALHAEIKHMRKLGFTVMESQANFVFASMTLSVLKIFF